MAGPLPPHLVEELRYVEVSARRRFAALRPGAYTSHARGRGLEFDRHRPYQPGDDVRQIDWNATARSGTPFLRETHAERELDVMVVADVSRSMELGTTRHAKSELQLLVAGSLLFSAASDGINTGLLAFGQRVALFEPPRRSRARAWRLLEELWAARGAPGRSAARPALQHLVRRLRRGAIVFLVSDFLLDEDLFAAPELKVLAAWHDVVGVVVEDPAEGELPAGGGTIELRDMESGRHRRVALSSAVRIHYAAAARRRREELARSFYGVPMDHAFVRSRAHVLEPILQLAAARGRA